MLKENIYYRERNKKKGGRCVLLLFAAVMTLFIGLAVFMRHQMKTQYVTGNGAEADRSLILVNPWNSLPEDYEVNTADIEGYSVDELCYEDLQNMLEDCRRAGMEPLICSAYRTWEKQEKLFRNKVQRLISQGYSEAVAEIEAGKTVAVPGTSEHQLGLAVDIVDSSNQSLDESQEDTRVQKWLMENSWKYGFILRYPNNKSKITGIIYEPWHYRYVGAEAAAEIYERGICLEEYLEK